MKMKSFALLIVFIGLQTALAVAATPVKKEPELIHTFVNGLEFHYADLTFQFGIIYEPSADGSPGDANSAFGSLNIVSKDKKDKKNLQFYPTLNPGSRSEPQDFSIRNLCFRANVESHKSNILQLKLYKSKCLKK